MGFNTTVVILNDGIHDLRKDAEFGRRLADAIMSLDYPAHPTWYCQVIESHHADSPVYVYVGENRGLAFYDFDALSRYVDERRAGTQRTLPREGFAQQPRLMGGLLGK